MFRLFRYRFRSPVRDQQTDQSHISSVRSAIQSAITGIDNEIKGLRRRLEKARDDAAFLLGTDNSDAESRDPAEGSSITAVEERLMGAERRIARLTILVENFRKVQVAFDRTFPEQNRP